MTITAGRPTGLAFAQPFTHLRILAKRGKSCSDAILNALLGIARTLGSYSLGTLRGRDGRTLDRTDEFGLRTLEVGLCTARRC